MPKITTETDESAVINAALEVERDENKLKYHSTRIYAALLALNDAVWIAGRHGVTPGQVGLPEAFGVQNSIKEAKVIANIDWQADKTAKKSTEDIAYYNQVRNA